MNLELKVSADDVRSLFTEDRRLLMAALKHKNTSTHSKYLPHLYVTPLTVMEYLGFGTVPNYLKSVIGFDEDSYESRITTAADTWRSLLASLEDKQATYDLDTLAGQHVLQLEWFAGLYHQLSGLNAAEMPDNVANSIDRGLNGLRMLITRSNMVYNPQTRAKFLRHVREGVVEEKYEQRLLHEAVVDSAPKTL